MSINSSCSALLDHVQSNEASLSPLEGAYFGHPPPPALHMVQVTSSDQYVLAAQTSRCVSVQLYKQDGDLFLCKSEPIDVFRLESSNDKESEEITCATLLCLDPSLQKDDENASRSAALVLGTNQNRVLAVQMQVLISMDGTFSLVCDKNEPPLEPLPVDKLNLDKDGRGSDSLASSRHGKSGIADTSRHGRRSISDLSRHGSVHGPRVPNNAFYPQGGVVSLSLYCMPARLLWISYRDGTIVRLHHAAFFSPSVVNEEAVLAGDLAETTIRTRVALPLSYVENESMTVLPLPKYHPSPLAPLSQARDDDMNVCEDEEEKKETVTDFQEALAFGGSGSATGGDDFLPAIAFFTSENQFAGRIAGDNQGNHKGSNRDGDLVGNVVGGTVAVVGGVLGAAFGAVKWSLGAGKGGDEKSSGHGNDQAKVENSVLSALHKVPNNIFSGVEIQDAPRQVTSMTVDPTGNLAAAADNLGRVLLIDLSSKQVIRTWKGVREASCYWIHQPDAGDGSLKPGLFLAIHSRQRSILDIWRCRYGPKVMSMKLDRDAELISIGDTASERPRTNCFLLQPHQRGGKAIKKVDPRQFETMGTTEDVTENKSPTDSLLKKTIQTSAQESAMQLQLLRQLLAKTQVPREAHDVFEIFTQISAINDLGSALDVLAGADQLEESMGVEGAEFHASAVQHCRAVLEETIRNAGSTAKGSALVKEFESKIVFHEQVVQAYEVLQRFEMGEANESVDEERVPPSSPWAIEAMSWITTYEAVTRTSIDSGTGPLAQAPLRFSAFAKACSSAGLMEPDPDSTSHHKIYFRDGAPTRNEVLIHVFRPLLKDIFKIRVVDSIFSSLGVSSKDQDNIDYLLKCFGNWFMSMSVREASRRSFFVTYSPLVRWLNDVAGNELEIIIASAPPKPKTVLVLKALNTFCTESDDLLRAFLLASLCHEAVTSAAKKQEDRTYGLVSQSKAVTPWRQLLRKLRMCLLVSLRLNGVYLGSFPITVKNVEAGDIFSVYQWLAHDELRMSHRHDEIISLEKACYLSGLSFDPSSEAGDNPKRLKMLHQACLAAAISEAEKEEYLLDMNDDDLLGALLLYLKSYNNPTLLAAHRALLLASQWQRKPSEITILDDCLDALRAIEDGERVAPLQAGVMLEVWQSAVRPLYRAIFFGLDDVHELDREEVSPLLEEELYLKQLGHRSLALLNLFSAKYSSEGKSSIDWSSASADDDSTGWPRVREDFILKEVVSRVQPIDRKTVDMHRVIVCGTLLSGDLQALSECVPDIYSAFLPMSLFDPVGGGEATASEVSEKQMDFLEHAVISRAREMQRSTFSDRLDLGEIEVLASLWNVDLRDVRTMFLLVMYELGKDSLVDQQLTMSTERNMDLDRLLQDGIGIACRRLNRVLNGNRSPQIRGIIGLLDADTCEFVREEAAVSEPLVAEEKDVEVSLASTHLLVLRLLSVASTTGDKQNLVKIHSLSILSGTLMKAMEQKS